uniref:Tripartite motif-containing protein 35-like n=1 Tax=Oryzias sinensis TaxID=183150 RepID=A0A8C7X3U6_9TELE
MSEHQRSDLSCPICRDVFRDPVVLTCSHSYCRACLQTMKVNLMKVKLRKHRQKAPWRNDDLVRAQKQQCRRAERKWRKSKLQVVCRLHAEKLKLFCVDHQEPLCLVCLHSDAHAGHNVKPIEEVARKHREQLRDLLKPLKEKLKNLEDVKEHLRQTAEHIQFQAQQTEKFLREQFKELQAFIQKEEETRIKALREEEKKKSLAMKVKIESLSKDIAALSETVRETEAALGGEEAVFLQNFRSAPQPVSGVLIDQAKHLGNLTFKVWKKMKTMASFTPVILDPNSANPELSLSQNLTAVTCGPRQNLPDNPERFSCFRIILGSKGFSSGTCSWDVEIPENTDWFVGVASESVHRKGTHPSCLWRIGCTNGEYVARSLTDPSTVLPNVWKLNRIRVHLDWERGKLVFFDLDASTHIHTFSHRFTETLFPYFNTHDICTTRGV